MSRSTGKRPSSGGESTIIPVSPDKLTLVNSQYELSSTAALYKV